MPSATLLLREEASASLSTLVEKSQQRKPPLPSYDLQLQSCQLDLLLKSKPETSPTPNDEGFESDIDSLSIVSSDGSFAPETKTTETDSANGSASSDSDTENGGAATTQTELIRNYPKESYNLVECVCYTDVKFPDVLLFVIKQEALVFKFDNLNDLTNFYLNFTALKAVTNQKAYSKNSSGKFNLLQRTDHNGVTHIEITREPEVPVFLSTPTSIISLNTPESSDQCRKIEISKSNTLQKNPNLRQRVESNFVHYRTLSHSSEILNQPLVTEKTSPEENSLRQVWTSAEDLLNTNPKRPERRKKNKGKAPLPPPALHNNSPPNLDVLRGEYVRVNVSVDATREKDFIAKSQLKDKKPTTKQNLVTFLSPKPKMEPSWTNSVPRMLKKQRSKSETRSFTPMAYRYIDTAPSYSPMGNRLFGLSPKLRDFGPRNECRWNSVGELSYKSEGNLKSVIKKDENKKKNEKKVTFSAYTTVQVV